MADLLLVMGTSLEVQFPLSPPTLPPLPATAEGVEDAGSPRVDITLHTHASACT